MADVVWNFYAGIGSRKTPPAIQDEMERIARRLADRGWTLRSGHAGGADQAFERGAGGKAQIFLPWPTFNGENPVQAEFQLEQATIAATTYAREHTFGWESMGRGVRALLARNAHQILGPSLDQPVGFVICWTRGGEETGGTGHAMRWAKAMGIPIFNLAVEDDREVLYEGMERDRWGSWLDR